MDDLREKILAARRPAQPQAVSSAHLVVGIAPESDSSFGSLVRNTHPREDVERIPAVRWADGILRRTAGRHERVVLAVRDAARRAEAKGISPTVDEIYVTRSIREGWNLSPDQLSKGLQILHRQGFIQFTRQRKGRHARFVLNQHREDQTSQEYPPETEQSTHETKTRKK